MIYDITADGVRDVSETGTPEEPEEEALDVEYYDLINYQGNPQSKANGDKVLLCVPLRDAEKVLPLLFRNMMNMTYYHNLIDIAFLVSDCSKGDRTMEKLTEYSTAMQQGKLLELLDGEKSASEAKGIKGSSDLYLHYLPEDYVNNVKAAYSPPYHEEYTKPFRSVQIYQKDFGQVIGQGFSDRHDVKVQGIRRKLMGRARNWLITSALKPYHSWVYWRDADIETSPGDILENMMRFSNSYDVIVPNRKD
ncbi:unnamed protein product [Ambrosiozyma monospora]|uniref:Unnamed protein product n=1 Tax=Ambrosiozyma monospora TaxID=43982 RepID=A0ACB5U1W4_AMBMO|nr:unnamed protein product [Ambrosiozyma monospora]